MLQDLLRQLLIFVLFMMGAHARHGQWYGPNTWTAVFLRVMTDVVTLHPLLVLTLICNVMIGWGIVKRLWWARSVALWYSVCLAFFWIVLWRLTAPTVLPAFAAAFHILLCVAGWVILTRPNVEAEF